MEIETAVAALSALAQTSRLAIFRHLVEVGPHGAFAGAIADALDLAPATLSFHLKELSHVGLITGAQEGRFIRYSANFSAMNALIGYLTENCCSGEPCGVNCAPSTPQKRSVERPARSRTPAARLRGGR
jgi:DNA-binding transcriptional ArsR family regulator